MRKYKGYFMSDDNYVAEKHEQFQSSEISNYIEVTNLNNRIEDNSKKSIDSSTKECINNINNLMKSLSLHGYNR